MAEKICIGCHDTFEVLDRNRHPSWRCDPCRAAHKVEYNRQWYLDHRDEQLAVAWDRYHDDPDVARNRALLRNYGITLADYGAMLEAQGGRCLLCGKPHGEGRSGVLHVDHDHDTGRVRGLLCTRCNRVIGMADEDPDLLTRMASYVR